MSMCLPTSAQMSLDSNNNVLIALQTANKVRAKCSVATMRCRCEESRRISNRLTHLERKNRRRVLRLREYQRLRDSVPSIARQSVSKLTVITEAVHFIDQLEAAVLSKFQKQGVPQCLRDFDNKKTSGNQLTVEDVKNLIGQLMIKEKPQKTKAFI